MKRSVNFRFAVFSAIGLILGILFSYCCIFGKLFGATVVAVSFVVLFVVFTFFSSANFKSAGKVLCFLIFAVCFIIGGLGFKITVENYKNADINGHILSASGKIDEISDKDDHSVVIVGDVNFSGLANGNSRYKIAVYVYGEHGLKLGDVVSFKTAIKDRTVFYNGKFSAAAISQNVKYYVDLEAGDIVKTESAPNIFQKCNLYVYDILKAGLNEDEFGIAYAVLTGNSDFIAEENLVAFRAAGIAHIFAVSGLHIGFLATAVYFALNKIRVKNYISFLLTFLLCLFYAGVCGFSASSVRAVIMFFALNFAKLVGLKYDALSSLFFAAFIILVLSPVQLFCVGFLLSFAVAFTVIALFNPLMRFLKFLPKKLAASLAVAFSAEIGSAPLLLLFFGNFPSLGLFINILFIPIAGVLFIALVLGVLLGGVFSPAICMFLQNYALYGLNFIITSLNFKIFLVGGFTLGGFAAAYYGAVVFAGGLFNLKRVAKTVLCVLLALITVAGTWTVSAIKNEKAYACVLGSNYLSSVLFTYDGQNVLVISDVSYKTFSERRLSGVLSRASSDDLTVILLRQNKYVDLVSMTVKLRFAAFGAGLNLCRLYYYGESDSNLTNVMSKTFAGFTAFSMSDGERLSVANGVFEFSFGGRCLVFTRKGYNTGVFSSLYDCEIAGCADRGFNTVICSDNHDTVVRETEPDRAVSFRPKSGYIDGETEGYLTLDLG